MFFLFSAHHGCIPPPFSPNKQSLTTALYPLSVIKTRQMALAGSQAGLGGAVATARGVLAADGVRGLYRGFGTVVMGMFPARMVSRVL